MITQFQELIEALADHGIEFIVVGGFAGTMHGAARATLDLDVVYRRTPDNLLRLVKALEGIQPYPRGAPPGLPFIWDRRTLEFGSNFTLTTSIGFIDLLGEITGGGTYEQLVASTSTLVLFDRECRYLTLSKLIEVKRAAGRPKDFEAIAELETLIDENDRP